MGRYDLDDDLFLRVVDRLWWGDIERKEDQMTKVTRPFAKVKMNFNDFEQGDNRDLVDVLMKWETRLMKEENQPDIPYNFLVGNYGVVYEGRGWNYYPSEPDTISICYIGDFTDKDPDWDRLFGAHNLILYGIKEKYIQEHFSLIPYKLDGAEKPNSTS